MTDRFNVGDLVLLKEGPEHVFLVKELTNENHYTLSNGIVYNNESVIPAGYAGELYTLSKDISDKLESPDLSGLERAVLRQERTNYNTWSELFAFAYRHPSAYIYGFVSPSELVSEKEIVTRFSDRKILNLVNDHYVGMGKSKKELDFVAFVKDLLNVSQMSPLSPSFNFYYVVDGDAGFIKWTENKLHVYCLEELVKQTLIKEAQDAFRFNQLSRL